jgi:diadenosine tetraphosphate (Ap4A) HIT family hydrolase
VAREEPNSATPPRSECEFCREFGRDPDARFLRQYAGVLSTRIVDREGAYAALPTIGQLFAGSMLVMPVRHHETLADAASVEGIAKLDVLIDRVTRLVSQRGKPVLFEHGARAETGGSCGVYHAHLHVVPAPGRVLLDDVFPHGYAATPCLREGLEANADQQEYLIARDTDGSVGYLRVRPSDRGRYPSQYFRRTLASRFGVTAHWDWRRAVAPEPALLEIIRAFVSAA